MTPAQLKQEILTGPLAAELAGPWGRGEDLAVAEILNRVDRPGRVPIDELKLVMYDQDIYGKAQTVINLPVPEHESGRQFYGLCHTLVGMIRDLRDVNVQNPVFVGGLNALVAAGWITRAQADQIAALANNRVSRAQQLGWPITGDTIGKARLEG